MIKLLKNAEVYAPEYLGKQDILIAGNQIVAISSQIDASALPNVTEFDCTGLKAMPGFIDGHVHIIGGGGEGGPKTRTPELVLSSVLRAGVTTVVGCLGTDGTTRSMESLLTKAYALEAEGITTYIYTGSYEVPTPTLTGSVKNDIILIEKVIGVGEIAISDHRSSQPTLEDIQKLSADVRVGGMLGGKPGIVHLHVGKEDTGIDYIFEIVANTDIPVTQFLPTHMGRTPYLLDQGLKLINMGGKIDITAGKKAVDQVLYLLNKGANIKGITISSDGNGSLPKFDDEGNLIGLAVGDMREVYKVWKSLIKDHNMAISDALQIVSSNIAANLNISDHKGCLKAGSDADIVLMDHDLNIKKLFAKGRLMLDKGVPIVLGTFEE